MSLYLHTYIHLSECERERERGGKRIGAGERGVKKERKTKNYCRKLSTHRRNKVQDNMSKCTVVYQSNHYICCAF